MHVALRSQPLRFMIAVVSLWCGVRVVVAMGVLDESALPGRAFALADRAPRLTLAAVSATPAAKPTTAAKTVKPAGATRRPEATAGRPAPVWRARIVRGKPVGAARIDRAPIAATPLELPPPGQRLSDRLLIIPIPRAQPEGIAPKYADAARTPSSQPATARSDAAPAAPSTTASASLGAAGGGRSWSGSAWAFWRRDGARGAIGNTGQLGGAQAGVRIDRRLARIAGVPLSLYGRASTALYRPYMPEAAVGLAIRPAEGKVPLMIGFERRIALDKDARNAFAVYAATGFNLVDLPIGYADGYAQAGMVGFRQRDAFVDGRLAWLIPFDDRRRFAVGGEVSGGAQPGLSRLDVGPVVEARLPLGGANTRLSVAWRERIAGHVRPGSGVAVTFGADF